MALSLKQLTDVCLLGQGYKQCRYLEGDDKDHTKYYCKRKSPDRAHIDDLVHEYMIECKDSGDDPKDSGVALMDNCDGYYNFKDVIQGYDQED